MIQSNYNEYTTVNKSISVFVPFVNVSHIQKGEVITDNRSLTTTSWIHFHNGKCVHVEESYSDVVSDFRDYLDNL